MPKDVALEKERNLAENAIYLYDDMMTRADAAVSNALGNVHNIGALPPSVEESIKSTGSQAIAMAMAWAYMAEKYRDNPPEKVEDSFVYRREAEEESKRIMKSEDFKTMIANSSVEEISRVLGNAKVENGKTVWEPVKYEEFADRFNQRLGTIAQEREKNAAFGARMNQLFKDLKATSSKTFAGRIKSFFVGNSDEYDKAMQSIEGLVNGTVSKEQARTDIQAYLDLRGNKVRNQAYGRDRFDRMMESLAMVMEPMEFKDYCGKIDNMRRTRDNSYTGVTNAEDYLSAEGKKQLREEIARKEAEQQEARKAGEERRKQAEEAQARREAEKHLAEDTERINNEPYLDDEGVMDQQLHLDKLRAKNLTVNDINTLQRYVVEHPAIREQARKIVQERKLNIKVPYTAVDKLDPETKKNFEDQQRDLRKWDKSTHPELYEKKKPEPAKAQQVVN